MKNEIFLMTHILSSILKIHMRYILVGTGRVTWMIDKEWDSSLNRRDPMRSPKANKPNLTMMHLRVLLVDCKIECEYFLQVRY